MRNIMQITIAPFLYCWAVLCGCSANPIGSLLAFSSNASKKKASLPQDKIMKSLTYYKLDKALSQDLIDSAETAIRSWSSQPSVFLSQPEQKAVSEAFKDLIGLKIDFAGGFQVRVADLNVGSIYAWIDRCKNYIYIYSHE